MSSSRSRLALAAIFAFIPIAAFADVSGTLTIQANTNVSMDTGTTVSSGGDFSWNGTTLTPVANCKALNATAYTSLSGTSGYNELTQALLSEFASLGSSAALTGLAVNTVVGYETNSGNFGKFLVTGLSGTTLTIQYDTYISTTPTVTGVLNNYSLISPGLPNSGIAPGTIMIIKGSNLASTTTVSALESSAAPGLPKSLNGASVSVTVGGATVTPAIYYAIATQIAVVLPSSTPAGNATVTVTYNGAASNAFSFQVVSTALGLGTFASGSYNIGIATDAVTGALITFTNSAKPGEPLVFWGSGAGADTADSDTTFTTTPHASGPAYTFYFGGVSVTPGYQGSSGYPGLNQVNITVPASAPNGCGVSVIGQAGNIVTNAISIPIMAGGGVCTDPVFGYNGTQLANSGTTNGGTYTSAGVDLEQSTVPTQGLQTIGGANFTRYSGGSETVTGTSTLISVGSCSIVNSNVSVSGTPPTSTGLDAGAITIMGPAGTQTLAQFINPLTMQPLVGTYDSMLASSFIPAGGGAYTVTGAGGKDVGAFTSSITLGPILNWTNQSADATISRASGIPITWTGGTPGTYVYIDGSSSNTQGANASFSCYAPVSAGSLTVPSYIALSLPAGTGSLSVGNSSTIGTFTASGLTTQGIFLGGISFGINATFQ